ncbi:glucosaminidase domain-containing protein [Tenacibaculum sp. IB213877]|uniref:glucosaminidase domain-containing protein n=1 Tax=Tenacibaculum sp. IB213877 TaxID=3097351 RepID=UPI002A59C6A2|nr:glucosaminidase domain-containing protein [Tenacibaculum sp. IB213877]MDY0780229.1 glucosaminidase domain-containing protein [Tenacibaculum sp. IB213877]
MMKLRVFLMVSVGVLLVSCGTNKKVVHTKPKPIIINEEVVINEEKPEVPQLEQISRPLKTNANHTEAYIAKFAPIAVKEMHKYKIPASITLAQGVLESGSGRSPLSIRSNNHFGIKCHKGWQGKSVTHDDDEIGECFRKYKYPETSYEDHSRFLVTRRRYARLFNLKHTDYKGWAYGLKRAGYATDKKYPAKLISIIHKYQLQKYDRIKPHQIDKGGLAIITTPVEASYHLVRKGDTLYSIAKRYNTTVQNLKKLNSLRNNTLSIGQQLIIN